MFLVMGPTIRRRRLGADLRRLREARSLKLEDVASRLGVAPSTLSRIETGKAPTRTSYLAIMLDLYGIDDQAERRTFMEMAREGQRKGWWAQAEDTLPAGYGTYLGLESESSAIDAFAERVVPGLASTDDYALAVLRASRPGLTAEQAGRLAAVQRRRRELLSDGPGRRVRLVIDEAALLRAVAPAPVMRQQLEFLARVQPGREVRVLQLASRTVLSPGFAVLSFASPGDGDVVAAVGIRGRLHLEQRALEVRAMRELFGALAQAALPPDRSAALIGDLAKRYDS